LCVKSLMPALFGHLRAVMDTKSPLPAARLKKSPAISFQPQKSPALIDMRLFSCYVNAMLKKQVSISL